MLHYAFSRKMPVQVIISANKEAILSEKEFVARWFQRVAVGYSDVIDPAEFEDASTFIDGVQKTWDAKWDEVFSADMSKLPELPLPPTDQFLPVSMRYLVLPFLGINVLGCLLQCYVMWWIASAVLNLLGPLAPLAVALVATYVAASLYTCSQPYDAVAVRARRKHMTRAAAMRAPTPLPEPLASVGANGEK